eukprot:m.130020 g.130020  ORF g.130020 m.130020 type:complete len:294 (-) comp14593_c0_seq2:673-1554(-)
MEIFAVEELDLSCKGLREVPVDIDKTNKGIKAIYLKSNEIRSLPKSFTSLISLSYVDLRFNRLSEIPPSIEKLRALRTLLLQGNLLSSLPTELGNIKALKALSLADNPLHFPPRDVVARGVSVVLSWLREHGENNTSVDSRIESELPNTTSNPIKPMETLSAPVVMSQSEEPLSQSEEPHASETDNKDKKGDEDRNEPNENLVAPSKQLEEVKMVEVVTVNKKLDAKCVVEEVSSVQVPLKTGKIIVHFYPYYSMSILFRSTICQRYQANKQAKKEGIGSKFSEHCKEDGKCT